MKEESPDEYLKYLGTLEDNKVKKRHVYMSDDGMYLYYIGIIDYLQDYNWNKKGENFLKGFRDDPNEISAVPPE